MLIIKGANFSANGTPIVDPSEETLNAIKCAIEAHYFEGSRYNSGYSNSKPNTGATNRNSFGNMTADGFGVSSFVITPKSGCKIAPLQSGSTYRWTLAWTTDPVTYDSFDTYPYIGGNLAFSDDSTISSGTSIWDFIDVSLVE